MRPSTHLTHLLKIHYQRHTDSSALPHLCAQPVRELSPASDATSAPASMRQPSPAAAAAATGESMLQGPAAPAAATAAPPSPPQQTAATAAAASAESEPGVQCAVGLKEVQSGGDESTGLEEGKHLKPTALFGAESAHQVRQCFNWLCVHVFVRG